jgi:hypothetical protein
VSTRSLREPGRQAKAPLAHHAICERTASPQRAFLDRARCVVLPGRPAASYPGTLPGHRSPHTWTAATVPVRIIHAPAAAMTGAADRASIAAATAKTPSAEAAATVIRCSAYTRGS